MKKFILPGLCMMLMGAQVMAQCPAGRFLNDMFSVSKSTVTYSGTYNLQMDIYQPSGDTMHARPVVILAHGGSFISGTKTDDPTVDTLCMRLARRGYVTASIDYRLTDLAHLIDSASAVDEVIKAMSDGKAAIRYFVKDAATTNTYKVDTNSIFIGGNSAGAVLYMHVAYINNITEAPVYISNAMTVNGGFEGNSGNAGYSTKFRGVINLAGALNKASFIMAGDVPSANAQGTADVVVPYNCGHALSGLVPVQLCGLGALEPAYMSAGVYHLTHVFPGDDHVPWSSDNAKMYTVDSLVTVFLYSLVCPGAAAVNDAIVNTDVNLFPNPAHEVVNVRTWQTIRSVSICDQAGRMLVEHINVNNTGCELNTSSLSAGIYFLRISFTDGSVLPATRKIIMQ